ncbi:MAG: dienelactone hydrolase family protein [Proteobacteria bacterium]|nr:dienelactone hydrolase family protein [Pseudomonadota bacterium]MDA1301476.1 dienelactone hydrolase family protein [Pseudomonadota bacterium]
MGEQINIRSKDGFAFSAYRAEPAGKARAAVLVIQEIFGVNQHIREVCDGYAADGYLALAPALFDRVEPGIELGYEAADMARGVELARGELKQQDAMADLQASIDLLAQTGPVGVVGYCFGGLLTWLCACHGNGIACAVGYYGGGIAGVLDTSPRVPTMLHFGELDAHIPMSDVEKIRSATPGVTIHTYDADHGFNCDHRGSFNAAAAGLARQRTLDFFAEKL